MYAIDVQQAICYFSAMPRLSERLQLAYTNLIPDQDVWDICCDHGYLGGAAYKSQQFKNIYFVDPVASIMQKLEKRFNQFLFNTAHNSRAYFKTQTGETITDQVTGNLCILGVGGTTICHILQALSENKYLSAQRLILSPHRDSEKLLNMLKNDSSLQVYRLIAKHEVIESSRARELFIFDLRT